MKVSDLKPNRGAKARKKRVARGPGSGLGKTAGRGHKGQKSRSGGLKDPRRFEGGRSILIMRLPKRGMRGQVPGAIKRPEYQTVNVARLAERFPQGGEVTPELMARAGLIRKADGLVKVLGHGEVGVALKVSAHAFSKSAAAKLAAAGGEALVIGSEKGEEA
ncbi:50S ribosomal protein L15 [Oceanithermus sp.]